MLQTEDSNKVNALYEECSWFKTRVEGPQGERWLRARFCFLLSKNYLKQLPWFLVADKESLEESTGAFDTRSLLLQNDSTDLNTDPIKIGSRPQAGHKFYINASVRQLLDLIVTHWNAAFVEKNVPDEKLHSMLTFARLRSLDEAVSLINETKHGSENEDELEEFYSCLTMLHYHETWASIVRDHHSVEKPVEGRTFDIEVQRIEEQKTATGEKETALIVGKLKVILNDSFTHMNTKLGLLDAVIIKIGKKQYFGVIVYVKATPINSKNTNTKQRATSIEPKKPIKIEMSTVIGIYVSKECREAVANQQEKTNSNTLKILKLSNMTSSVRMISAIYRLKDWPYRRSLVMPKPEDPYFHLPSDYDPSNTMKLDGCNPDQLRAIDISSRMYEDAIARLHMIHGPPGTGKTSTTADIVVNIINNHIFKKRIILVCAPSNSACDEISCRILQTLSQKQRDEHTLIRVGSKLPVGEDLSNNFLTFLVLEEIFEILTKNPKIERVNLTKLHENILSKGTVIVTTLNNCASSCLSSLVDKIDLVIIDEASQSLMADCFIPHRFHCEKMILVGDPKQLPPTVMSITGQKKGLNQSLYAHLFEKLEQHDRITTLTVQYRMHSKICSFPSRKFYDGKLKTDPSVDERMGNSGLRPLYYYNRSISGEKKEDDFSIKNEGEAQFVKKLCELLIDHIGRQEPNVQNQICVISPYRAHLRSLQRLLPPHVEVMTADGAQGRENNFIIFSCTRSGDKLGFLEDERRLNVALTRARKGLYIVGNLRQLGNCNQFWESLVKDAVERKILCDVQDDQPILPTIPLRQQI